MTGPVEVLNPAKGRRSGIERSKVRGSNSLDQSVLEDIFVVCG